MFLFNSSCKQVTLSMKTALVTHPRLMLYEKAICDTVKGKCKHNAYFFYTKYEQKPLFRQNKHYIKCLKYKPTLFS